MSGSGIGGYLAEPYGRVPLVGSVEIFSSRPYTLPGTALLLISILATIPLLLFVPEVRKVWRQHPPAPTH